MDKFRREKQTILQRLQKAEYSEYFEQSNEAEGDNWKYNEIVEAEITSSSSLSGNSSMFNFLEGGDDVWDIDDEEEDEYANGWIHDYNEGREGKDPKDFKILMLRTICIDKDIAAGLMSNTETPQLAKEVDSNSSTFGKDKVSIPGSSHTSKLQSTKVSKNHTIIRENSMIKTAAPKSKPPPRLIKSLTLPSICTSSKASNIDQSRPGSVTKVVPSRPKTTKKFIEPKKGSKDNAGDIFPINLLPVGNTAQVLKKGLSDLDSSDWEVNVEGLRTLIDLVRDHPQFMKEDLHKINMAAIRHLSNLRSQVCRAACFFFQEMFCHLGKRMDTDMEKIGEKLLDKTADTSKFIRESSHQALETMVDSVSPIKTLNLLENIGLKYEYHRHRNSVVKTAAAKLLNRTIKNIGPKKCLIDFGEKIISMMVKILQEARLETRTEAKIGLLMLMENNLFESALRTYLRPEILSHVRKSIDSLKKDLY